MIHKFNSIVSYRETFKFNYVVIYRVTHNFNFTLHVMRITCNVTLKLCVTNLAFLFCSQLK